jgi:IS30 family transposase
VARPMTRQEIDQIWDLVMAGGTFGRISRQLGRHQSVVSGLVGRTGGVRPPKRTRALGRLSLQDREDIAAGVAAGESMRAIARRLGRPASTVSRELARNGGRSKYRPSTAENATWARASRPKPSKLALNPRLREQVIEGLKLQWSPE